MQLEPCPACQRHVRVDELVCPFCAAGIAGAMARAPTRRMPRQRLGRAALMSFGLSAGAAALVGCDDDANTVPVYGAPVQPEQDAGTGRKPGDASTLDASPPDASAKDAAAGDASDEADAAGSPSDAGTTDAAVADAGTPLDAGRDAGRDAGPTVAPLYGGVPVYGAPAQTKP